jgi:16S rRNA (cytosine1407-C5)-methyltransferase
MDKRLEKLPKEFMDKLQKLYPQQFAPICRTFLETKRTTFRVNLLKTDIPKLRSDLNASYIHTQEVHGVPGAFMLSEKQSLRSLQDTDIYKEGRVYVQNISSMLPVKVLLSDLSVAEAEKHPPFILDMCSAPGGKTTQIVSELKGHVKVLAVERDRPRFYKLQANVKMQGCDPHVQVINGDSGSFFKTNADRFDRILVDAPCSSESGFDANEPRTYGFWSTKRVNECRRRQKMLLYSGLRCLKVGGVLVYSTCTFSPEENESVVAHVLGKFGDSIVLEDIAIPFKNVVHGLTTWDDDVFPPSVKKTRRVIPTDSMESFYVARFRKLSSDLPRKGEETEECP